MVCQDCVAKKYQTSPAFAPGQFCSRIHTLNHYIVAQTTSIYQVSTGASTVPQEPWVHNRELQGRLVLNSLGNREPDALAPELSLKASEAFQERPGCWEGFSHAVFCGRAF